MSSNEVRMFLSMSRFRVGNDLDEAVREAFIKRPHRVDEAAGFVRMEVASPTEDPKEFWLLTWWTDQASFQAWHKSHAYRESHSGIPKGLRLDPTRTWRGQFRVFTS
jgi:heme oxygenase (mycobilin-producing)